MDPAPVASPASGRPPSPVAGLLSALLALLLVPLALALLRRLREYGRVVRLMGRIPGPPAHPLLGHGVLVLQLDRFKFVHGTYARKSNRQATQLTKLRLRSVPYRQVAGVMIDGVMMVLTRFLFLCPK